MCPSRTAVTNSPDWQVFLALAQRLLALKEIERDVDQHHLLSCGSTLRVE
jgi:hypothetical protein